MTTLPGRLLTLEALQDLGLSPSTVTRAVRRGDLLRIRQGVYATPSWWRDLGAEGRLRQMHAALALRAASAPVFGHWRPCSTAWTCCTDRRHRTSSLRPAAVPGTTGPASTTGPSCRRSTSSEWAGCWPRPCPAPCWTARPPCPSARRW
ncbi:hypothetical protein E7Z53_05300 [Kocuria salina]|uniref:type IV toxin-antitoxin system AbiEi family antitoxin domain-containing protein n=1 Tax=Kocuria salina TaxID=1929416 RepID=UPI001594B4EE|nr:hypothetical protein [Kocuria salina]